MDSIKVPPYFVNGVHRITIRLIGAGGNGSLILTKLARLNQALIRLDHPGLFVTCMDFDKVEEHNVGRQMFTDADVGEYKSVALISKVNMAFGTDWNANINKAEGYYHLDLSNIVIIAVDNVESRRNILRNFYSQNSYDVNQSFFLIDCGNGRDFGQVLLTDHKHKYLNLFEYFDMDMEKQETVEIQGHGCNYALSLNEQDLFVNDWVSLYVITIIKDLLFKKQIDYQGFIFNIDNHETKKLTIKMKN